MLKIRLIIIKLILSEKVSNVFSVVFFFRALNYNGLGSYVSVE